jgi:hypothetical protein
MAIRSSPHHEAASVRNVVDAQEGDHDIIGQEQEGHNVTSAAEDHEREACCDGGKSSDEFISIEEEDGMSSEELKLGLGSSHQEAPHDDSAEADNSGLGESSSKDELDAIEVEEEEVMQESDQSRRRRQASSSRRPPSAEATAPITAARSSSSRKRRETVSRSRSRRPRWQ